MKKKLSALLLAVILIALLCSVSAYAENPNVIDNAGVLGAAITNLDNYASNVSENYRFDVVVLFADTLNGRSAEAYTDDFYDYNGFGYGETRDGIILMVCPESRDYHISGTGNGIAMFDGHRLDVIERDVVNYLSAGKWGEAAAVFISDCEQFMSEGMPEVEEPEEKGFHFSLSELIGSLLAGFGIAFVPGKGMKSQLKSVGRKNDANHYIKPNGIAITNSQDNFVTMTVTRRKIETDNNRSGGSNVHMSSSGTMHSGRGGKF